MQLSSRPANAGASRSNVSAWVAEMLGVAVSIVDVRIEDASCANAGASDGVGCSGLAISIITG
eukprot:6475301-Prymnesium_polylepis.1